MNKKNITMELITVNRAQQLLSTNIDKNRAISQRVVEKYALDMKSGLWEENGETIKIDENGNLIDGQHRLSAIIMSGIPCRIVVVSGIERSAFKTIDRGKSRTIGDTLKIEGEVNTNLLAATMSWLLRWEKKVSIPKQTYMGLTSGEAKELLSKNPGIRKSVQYVVPYTQKLKGMCAPSIICLSHFLFSRLNPEKCDDFFKKLFIGNELSADSPILKVREKMREMKTHRNIYPDYDYLALLIISWNNYVLKKCHKSKLTWSESSARFPIPISGVTAGAGSIRNRMEHEVKTAAQTIRMFS